MKYFDIIRSNKKLQGGFIWDWVDQGMQTKTADGRTFFAYGGDLGGFYLQNDENFCANGLVAADRTPHPGLYEVKKVYAKIIFSTKDISKGWDGTINGLQAAIGTYVYQIKGSFNGKTVNEKGTVTLVR